MFNRQEYYSQTEATKQFKISVERLKQLIVDHNLSTINNVITLHTLDGAPYEVTTNYILKKDLNYILDIK